MTIIPITSRAALIRAIAIPGVQVRVVDHWQRHLIGTLRTPEKVQTNGYFYRGARMSDLKVVRMWCPTPKASGLRFNPDGSVTYCEVPDKQWTLVFEVE